jgi:hypothetical protein
VFWNLFHNFHMWYQLLQWRKNRCKIFSPLGQVTCFKDIAYLASALWWFSLLDMPTYICVCNPSYLRKVRLLSTKVNLLIVWPQFSFVTTFRLIESLLNTTDVYLTAPLVVGIGNCSNLKCAMYLQCSMNSALVFFYLRAFIIEEMFSRPYNIRSFINQ